MRRAASKLLLFGRLGYDIFTLSINLRRRPVFYLLSFSSRHRLLLWVGAYLARTKARTTPIDVNKSSGNPMVPFVVLRLVHYLVTLSK
jgi:hypothetical protein